MLINSFSFPDVAFFFLASLNPSKSNIAHISMTGQPVKSLSVMDTKQGPILIHRRKITITAITTMVMIATVFLITIIYLFYLLTSPYNTNQNK